MIELGVLGLLRESDLHGYELKKRLREALGPLSSVSFGSLYPALNRLEAAGHVKAVTGEVAAPGVPMMGSFGNELAAFRAARRRTQPGPRNRKVYGITDRGEARLAELLADPSDDERSFPLKLAFARWCDPPARIALLERRRLALEARLREGRRALGGSRLDRYVRSLLEHDAATVEADLAWLDGLLDAERASDPTTPRDPEPTGEPE